MTTKYDLPLNIIDETARQLSEYHYSTSLESMTTNSCGPVAITIATGDDHVKLIEGLISAKLTRRRSGGMFNKDIREQVMAAGYDVEQVYNYTGDTVRTFKPEIESNYMIFVSGHVLSYRAGLGVVDWTRGRGHTIREVWRITKSEDV